MGMGFAGDKTEAQVDREFAFARMHTAPPAVAWDKRRSQKAEAFFSSPALPPPPPQPPPLAADMFTPDISLPVGRPPPIWTSRPQTTATAGLTCHHDLPLNQLARPTKPLSRRPRVSSPARRRSVAMLHLRHHLLSSIRAAFPRHRCLLSTATTATSPARFVAEEYLVTTCGLTQRNRAGPPRGSPTSSLMSNPTPPSPFSQASVSPKTTSPPESPGTRGSSATRWTKP